jgi:hypothetical protein
MKDAVALWNELGLARFWRRTVTSSTIAFTNQNTITDSGNQLGNFRRDDRIRVTGSNHNNGSFTVDQASAGSIQTRETTTQEIAGATITITRHKNEGAYMATRAERKDRLDQIVSQNFTAAWLAFLTTIGFFLLIAALLWVSWLGSPRGVPPTPGTTTVGGGVVPTPGTTTVGGGVVATVTQGPFHDLLNTLVGIVGTAWATIVGFYFGSSSGSRQKSETLSQVALAHNPAPSSSSRTVTSSTIAFANPNTITDSGNQLGIFQREDRIRVTGSNHNNGSFTVDRASASSIQTRETTIQTETAGATITITTL